MKNTNTTACTACTADVLATGKFEAVETITVPAFIDCKFCGRNDFRSGRTIVRPVTATGFQVGDAVLVQTARQGRGLTGRPSVATRQMEIGAVVEHEGSRTREAGTYYRLRRPGAKTRGGQVLWAAKDLTRA